MSFMNFPHWTPPIRKATRIYLFPTMTLKNKGDNIGNEGVHVASAAAPISE